MLGVVVGVLLSYVVPLLSIIRDPGGSMSQVVGSNNSYKPITNTTWVRARLCRLQKGCTRLATTSDKVYQLFAHSRRFSPGTPASSNNKTDRHDIAEILLQMTLNTKNQSIHKVVYVYDLFWTTDWHPIRNAYTRRWKKQALLLCLSIPRDLHQYEDIIVKVYNQDNNDVFYDLDLTSLAGQ